MTLPGGNSQSADTPEARQYNRIRRRIGIADFLVSVAVLGLLLVTGWTGALRDAAYLAAGERYYPALFLYTVMLVSLTKLAGLPLDYYSFRLEHRFRLSNQRLPAWLRDQVKSWLVGLAIAVVLLQLLYFTIRLSPEWWWLMAWAVFIVLSVALARLAPVLLFPIFYKFKPLENEELKRRLVRLGERAGTEVRGVYEWKLSEKSNKANAALAGMGRTRRIILADTLLENYSEDEIEAIMAHELGHHVHRHLPKGIAVQVVTTFAGFWLADQVLRWAVEQRGSFQGLFDFANLPLLALVFTALSLVLMPLLNAYSRYNERQADLYCWRSIPSVEPFITSMEKLATQNLAERQPSRWVEALFHSHPAISRRIAAAQAYQKAKG